MGTTPQNLLPNPLLQPFNHASNSLCSQPDARQGRNFFRTHSLPEIQPENHAVALGVRPSQAAAQIPINFLKKHPKLNLLFAAIAFSPGLGVNIGGRNMQMIPAGSLASAMLEIVMRGIGRGFFEVSQDRFRLFYRKIPE